MNIIAETSWLEFAKILFGVVVACSGWLIVHYFTSLREIAAAKRAIRLEALVASYKALVRTGIDGVLLGKGASGKDVDHVASVEDAIAIIHLFGTKEQAELANDYVSQIQDNQRVDATLLVNSLRSDVRGILGASDEMPVPAYLRIRVKS
ncbi:hypothetical protein IFT63_01980 [Stenotrophomonas sp. CFBP 13724]|uniref:hypothetical protein n=1 Tax=Stenotrophomonas sp. CFBP 13724 TaxID=2775298 RepID=UPI001781CCC1|nr:hypothetical protein [Stenotrophomonas sp. CFBP 13724]MBD8642357.1 hypothetical protein [Stenotrophomonas sp. CFBP 13724]